MNFQLDYKNKTILATIGVIAITFIAGNNLIYKANVQKAEALKSRISEAKSVKSMAQELKIINERIKSRAVISNESSEPSAFLSKIVDIATSSDIKVDSIKAGNVIAEGPYKFLPCGISFKTQYPKLMTFMKKLEEDSKYIKVESLSVAALTSADALEEHRSEKLVAVTMDLSGFYFE